MKKEIEIVIRDHILHVRCGQEFATVNRHPDSKGVRKITFSIPLEIEYANVIENSGIAEVDAINFEECTITFRSLSFYETHLMAELITDIFERYENKDA